MSKNCFPNAKLEFMKEVGYEELIKIELEIGKTFCKVRKGVLFKILDS
jgi:hypothetical protein